MNLYIGQEVMALVTDGEQKGIEKGALYVVKSLRSSPCKCDRPLVDVGFKSYTKEGEHPYLATCGRCGTRDIQTYRIRWYAPRHFATIDQDISELTEVLNQPAFQ